MRTNSHSEFPEDGDNEAMPCNQGTAVVTEAKDELQERIQKVVVDAHDDSLSELDQSEADEQNFAAGEQFATPSGPLTLQKPLKVVYTKGGDRVVATAPELGLEDRGCGSDKEKALQHLMQLIAQLLYISFDLEEEDAEYKALMSRLCASFSVERE